MKTPITILVCLVTFLSNSIASYETFLNEILQDVVMIISLDESSQPLGIGSGFIVGENGEIATNYHVIEGASQVWVKFANGDEKHEVVSVIHKSPQKDLAVIQIEKATTPVILGDDDLLTIGKRILAIGNPEGLEGTVSEGIVSGFRKMDDYRLIQITAPISPGSSGGPVITENGKIIGIATASIISGQNLNFAVPVNELKKLLKGKKDKLSLNPISLPIAKVYGPLPQQEADKVKILNMGIIIYPDHFNFSLQNNLRRDIKATSINLA